MKKIKRNFFEITVKAVIVRDDGKILLVKRSKDSAFGVGKFDLPGGKLEEGENIKAGLAREIQEEIGLEVEIGPILYVFDFEKKYDKKYDIGEEELLISGKGIRFLAYHKSGEVKLSGEHETFEWVEMEEALGRFGSNDFEKDKKVAIKRAKDYLDKEKAWDGWLRCRADFENYRKRQEQERKELIQFANTNLIMEILPVLDNFRTSTDHIPDDQKDSSWVTGIMYIQKQLEKILDENDVKEMDIKKGDEFDPRFHEAVKGKEDHEADGKIEKVLQKGYLIGDKVIRAARVTLD